MLDRSAKFDAEKMAFNLGAKASMREFLRSKTWEEKVESIERMNEASKIARAAMKEAMERQAKSSASNLS
jgi:20S proteasome alpha/beta subunit